MKKRILSLLVALVLLCGLLPAAAQTAAAADADDWANEITVFHTIETELVAAIRAGKTVVNISGYHLHHDDIQLAILNDYSPYISSGISIDCLWNSIGANKGYYAEIKIHYPDPGKMSLSQINAYFDKVEAKVAEVDAMLAAVQDPVDKVLALHDYLIYNSEYDFSLEITADSFNTAGILMNRRGVCQGYTYAFMYLINRAGIECHTVESAPMNHTWNVIKIGNNYYHVDPTWDDPTPDVPGMVGHKFVLLSDAAVSGKRSVGGNKPHYGWDELPVSCTDTTYDFGYWYGVDSMICYSGNDRYYCRDGWIVKNTLVRGEETPLIAVGEWPVWGEDLQFYTDYFTGLCMLNGKLYYNTATELRCLDPETLEDEAVYTPDTSTGYIYGCAVRGDKMCYEIKQSPNETGVRYEIPLETIGVHVHSYTAAVTAPTCTEAGYTTHTCACGDSYKDTYVDALGHDWDEGKVTKEPTETATGEKTFTCKRCGATRTEELPKAQHVHSYTAVVTAPTCTEKGYTTHTCACGDSYVDTYVNALGHNYVGGVCTRCGAKDPNPPAPVSFNDVRQSDWYYAAVNYAVSKGLMNGVGNNNFAPNDPMTRAMLVTVLWRYEGSPQEGKNGFTDVPDGQWYTQAVAWAAEKGIVGGVGNGKFSPDGNITREQMAAILFRYAQGKGFDTSKRDGLSGFSDRNKVSSYATDAIAWAVAEGIIGGSDGKLDPQGNATRAQVSTILMRFIEKFAS